MSPHEREHVEALRNLLEGYRLRGNGRDQSIMPVLAALEAIDLEEFGKSVLRRMVSELNKAWWRRESHGSVAQRSAALLLRWMLGLSGQQPPR